jgi:hypothetical protein
VQLGLVLGGVYGIGLGTFAIFRGADGALLQAIASTCKVPLLFLLTLTVTFPSLYVFAALQRLPLDVKGTLRLMLLAIVVHLAILASLAPVFAFFAASTDSYAFMLLLNVAVFALGGVLGVMVLRRAAETMFGQLAAKERAPAEPPAQPAPVKVVHTVPSTALPMQRRTPPSVGAALHCRVVAGSHWAVCPPHGSLGPDHARHSCPPSPAFVQKELKQLAPGPHAWPTVGSATQVRQMAPAPHE